MDIFKGVGQAYKDGTTFRDVDVKGGKVSGYFSSFGFTDDDGDVIHPGSYKKTIAEIGPKSIFPRIKHVIDHEEKRPFTRLDELEEDQFGLRYVGVVGPHADAQDFLLKCHHGLITEHSIRIVPTQQKADPINKINNIYECKMKEGSSLHFWGANKHTPLISISKSIEDLHAMYERLKKALTTGTYTDKSMEEFQTVYNQIGELLKSIQQPDPLDKGTTADDDLSQASLINIIDKFKNAVYNGTN